MPLYNVFCSPLQIGRAPVSTRPALQLLATLYGLARIEQHLDFYLANEALGAQDRAALRTQVGYMPTWLCA